MSKETTSLRHCSVRGIASWALIKTDQKLFSKIDARWPIAAQPVTRLAALPQFATQLYNKQLLCQKVIVETIVFRLFCWLSSLAD